MKKILIENKIENLNQVTGFIETFGEEYELDQRTVFELNLVLDELITNIISYAYDDKAIHLIEISLEKEKDLINIQVIDDGKEFNPLKKEKVDTDKSLDEKEIGGLGIHLVKQKTDIMNYERKNDRNILSLSKKMK